MRKKNIIGSRIRKARRDSHFTQMKLATQMQLLGVRIDRAGIAKIETGIRPVSDIEITAIAKILQVSLLSLFEESGENLKKWSEEKS